MLPPIYSSAETTRITKMVEVNYIKVNQKKGEFKKKLF
jgi:hypothetical protein